MRTFFAVAALVVGAWAAPGANQAFADTLSEGTYKAFGLPGVSRLNLEAVENEETALKVSGALEYRRGWMPFSGAILAPTETEGVWTGEAGTMSVSYRRGTCYYPVQLVATLNGDNTFKVDVFAPRQLRRFFWSRRGCHIRRTAGVWSHHNRDFVREAQRHYDLGEIEESLPDGERGGAMIDVDVEAQVDGNNYRHVRVVLSLDHPHLGDILAKLHDPSGNELNGRREIINREKVSFTFHVPADQEFEGTWRVQVADFSEGSEGTVKGLVLSIF